MKILFYIFLITILSTHSILGQTNKLDDIIVTATKVPVSIKTIGNSVEIIDSDDLQKYSGQNITDVLRLIKGIDIVQSGNLGNRTMVYIRGASSSHTLVLLNGVELNDPSQTSNEFDYSNLLADNIEKIEIVKGPQSVLYGSAAMGGVINIITKKNTGKNFGNAALKFGSNSYKSFNANYTGNIEKFDYSFGGGWVKTEGYSAANEKNGNTEKDAYKNLNFNGNIGYRINKSNKLHFQFYENELNVDLDNFTPADDTNYKMTGSQYIYNFGYECSYFKDLMIKTNFYKTQTERISTDADDIWNNFKYSGNIENINSQIDVQKIKNNIISVGIEHKKEYCKASGDFGWVDNEKKNAVTKSVYFQDIINFSGIDFLVGIRNDRHDNFGRETTYKTALNYTYEDFSLSLKSSYGKGFKAPSLYNLYSAYGSASLQPEISNNFDLAIYKYFKNGLCSLTYFNNRFKELIDFDYTNWIYYNVNRAKSYGYEFEFNYDFSSFPVMVDIQYTYMQTESANGKQLLLRPEHKGEAIINYDINNFKFSPSLRYVGKRYDVPYVEIPSHIIFDFYCKYKMKNCAIQFQLNNIANKQYEETEGYGAAGRNFVIGMDFNF